MPAQVDVPVCATCRVQFAPSAQPPDRCPICEDERQFVPKTGQAWTTVQDTARDRQIDIREMAPGLTGIGVSPGIGIHQRALLAETPNGNLMWDSVGLITAEGVAAIEERGGAMAIAISHPHFQGAMIDWSIALGDIPVYIHAADADWVMRPHPNIRLWDGETEPLDNGMTLIRCGGHFPGGAVAHWPQGADGKGALLTADVIAVAADTDWASFMYSFPNYLPLSAGKVRAIADAVASFEFDAIYGGWWGSVMPAHAKANLARSVTRYIDCLRD